MSKPDINSRRRLAVAGMGSHDPLDIVNEFYTQPVGTEELVSGEYWSIKVCILAERLVVAERHREELREQNRRLILAGESVERATCANDCGKKLNKALLKLEKAMKWQSR
jgi:hypothetical protein